MDKNLMIAIGGRLLLVMILIIGFIFISKNNVYPQKSAIVIVVSEKGLGTGFITNEGIYTANHVSDTDTLNIIYYNKEVSLATVIKRDTANDILLLKPDRKVKTKVLKFANKELKEFDEVYTICHPASMFYMQYKGYVHKENGVYYIVSFDLTGGASGAPLLHNGKVYGMIQGAHQNMQVTYCKKMIDYGK